MRLWHKNMISKLPREQLVAQWRECSAIAGAIIKNGTPNHILVNYILDYPLDMFISYSEIVRAEMTKRGYRTMENVMEKIKSLKPDYIKVPLDSIYSDIHDEEYYSICWWNLYEKYLRGGISQEEASKLGLG